MTALTSAPQVPDFNGFFRDLLSFRGGCSGCYGSRDSQSNGCYGTCHGGFGSRIRAFFNREGCNGSCYGSCSGRNNSCMGSGYACSGSTMQPYSCFGNTPIASNSCAGGMVDGFGSPYAVPAPAYYGPAVAYSGCFGSGQPSGMPSPGYPAGPGFPATPMPAPSSGPMNIPSPGVPLAPNREAPPPSVSESTYAPRNGSASRATVVIKLPPDAKLFAENRYLAQTSGERSFVTPELPSGREYHYTFRVEYERAGRSISESKKLTVRPGVSTKLEFEDLLADRGTTLRQTELASSMPNTIRPTPVPIPVPATGPAPAKLTVTVPEGATLYIDKKKDERSDRVREYTTPPLPPGKEYAYYMTVEMMKDGQPEYVYQKVVFRAGEIVPVDFTKNLVSQR